MKIPTLRFWFLLFLAIIFIPLPGKAEAHGQSNYILFAVIGDYGLAGQPAADVASLVKSWNPDFIVTTGDNNYPDGIAETMCMPFSQVSDTYWIPVYNNLTTNSEIRIGKP